MSEMQWVAGGFGTVLMAGAGLYMRGVAAMAQKALDRSDQAAACNQAMAIDMAAVKSDLGHLREVLTEVRGDVKFIRGVRPAREEV